MKPTALWLGASALVFMWSGMAVAQDEPSADETQAQDDNQIIVTAERRNENLMTTAASASAGFNAVRSGAPRRP